MFEAVFVDEDQNPQNNVQRQILFGFWSMTPGDFFNQLLLDFEASSLKNIHQFLADLRSQFLINGTADTGLSLFTIGYGPFAMAHIIYGRQSEYQIYQFVLSSSESSFT